VWRASFLGYHLITLGIGDPQTLLSTLTFVLRWVAASYLQWVKKVSLATLGNESLFNQFIIKSGVSAVYGR
jgi:hypothetical protein